MNILNIENCKICNNPTKKIENPKTGHIYHQCPYCQFISKDEGHFLTLEQEKNRYLEHNNSNENEGYKDFFIRFINTAVQPFCKGKDGLDFGSGPVPILSKVMTEEYGFKMDIYDKFFAKDKVYHNKMYDLVTCTEVIEHIDNPLQYIKLFYDIIKKDGIIAIMTLLHPNDSSFFDWFYIRDKSHISFFTKKTFEIIAEKIGLEIIFCDNKRYLTFKKL